MAKKTAPSPATTAAPSISGVEVVKAAMDTSEAALARRERARRAASMFGRLQPTLTGFARSLTGRPEVKVVAGASSCTDGTTIYLRPPIELGDVAALRHDRQHCDKRDSDDRQLCEACRIREDVMITLYHEVGHIAFDSFDVLDDAGRKAVIERAVRNAAKRADGGTRAAKLGEALEKRPPRNYMEAAHTYSPFLPVIVNALEDVRVNVKMYQSRPGTFPMFRGQAIDTFESGIDFNDGQGPQRWRDAPLNAQAVVGLFAKAAGYDYEEWFNPEIVKMLNDPEVDRLLLRVSTVRSVAGIYEIAIPALEALRKHGYCLAPDDAEDDPPPAPPEPEEDDDDDADTSDDDDEDGDDDGEPNGMTTPGGSKPGEDGEPSDEAGDEPSGPPMPGDGDSQSGSSSSDLASAEDADGDDDGEPGDDDDEEADGEPSDDGDEEADGDDDGEPGDESDGDDDGEPGGEGADGDTEVDYTGEHPEGDHGEADSGDDMTFAAGGGDAITRSRVDDSAEVEKWLKEMGDHSPMEPTEEDEADAREVARAVVQDSHFDEAATGVCGVRIHHLDNPIILTQGMRTVNLTEQMFFGAEGDRYHGGGATSIESFRPPESILGRALLEMRVTFEENRKGKHQRNLKSGKVNGKVLGRRAATGDPRLFGKKILPGKRDYHVVITLDISGSTMGSRLTMIKKAAMAQAELLHRTGVPFELWAHTGNHHYDPDGSAAYSSGYYGRVMDLDMGVIKGASEPWDDRTKARLARLRSSSANLDGHTLEFCRKRLDDARATDKILMYYTDGAMPAENYDEELAVLEREIKTCRQRGYTLLAVGINNSEPEAYGFETVRVDSMADVPKVVTHLGKRLAS